MKFSKIFGAAMLVAAVASASATVHFYDGFETGTTGNPLDAAIWNGMTTGTDLAGQAVYAESGSFFNTAAVEIFVSPSKGSKMASVPIGPTGRFRRFGNQPQKLLLLGMRSRLTSKLSQSKLRI